MKSPYVSELEPNQVVTAIFLVQHKDIRQKKSGEPYLSLVLGDRTGDLEAKMWDNAAEVMETFDRDDFLKVRGLLQVHQNRLQLTVHKLQKQANETVDFSDFFPASSRNAEQIFAELQGMIETVGNIHLRALLNAFASDPDIASKLKIAPAAKSIHHAFLGGLLEHILSLCNLSKLTAAHYSDIDLDLLLTGAILHDIGKLYELAYERSFSYTTDGQLLGHIIIGLRMVDEKIRTIPNFPAPLRKLVEHMVISHHGELEYGSPKVPAFPEALLLHHLDNMDSKMESMRAFLEKDKHIDGCWTGYSTSLERSVLKKRKYLEKSFSDPVPGLAATQTTATSTPQMQTQSVAVGGTPPPIPRALPAQSLFGEKLKNALKP